MTSELSRTISTCAIWLATAVIFTFGLFRMNGDFIFFMIVSLIIAGAALGATAVVWRAPKQSAIVSPQAPEAAPKA